MRNYTHKSLYILLIVSSLEKKYLLKLWCKKLTKFENFEEILVPGNKSILLSEINYNFLLEMMGEKKQLFQERISETIEECGLFEKFTENELDLLRASVNIINLNVTYILNVALDELREYKKEEKEIDLEIESEKLQ